MKQLASPPAGQNQRVIPAKAGIQNQGVIPPQAGIQKVIGPFGPTWGEQPPTVSFPRKRESRKYLDRWGRLLANSLRQCHSRESGNPESTWTVGAAFWRTASDSVIPAKAGIQNQGVIPAQAGIQNQGVIPAKAGIQKKESPCYLGPAYHSGAPEQAQSSLDCCLRRNDT